MATSTMMKPTETDFKIGVDMLHKPEQALESATLSALCTKQMVAVSISAICYIRGLYPQDYFRSRQIGKLAVKILRNMKNDPKVTRFLNWIRGAFQAMNLGYLKDIIFGVQPPGDDNMNRALESYIFRVKYDNSSEQQHNAYESIPNSHVMNVQASGITAGNLENNILKFIQNCIDITGNLPKLPDGCNMTMMLTYHDVTPDDYEPPGFKPSEFETYDYPEGSKKFKIAKFSTPYHSIRLDAIASIVECPDSQRSDEEIPSSAIQSEMPNPSAVENIMIAPETTDVSHINTSMSKLKTAPDLDCTDISKLFSPREKTEFEKSFEAAQASKWEKEAFHTNSLLIHAETITPEIASPEDIPVNNESEKDSVTTYGEVKVSCVCENDDEFHLMIYCASCSFWSHGACYGYLTKPPQQYVHNCVFCCDADDKLVCTDLKIASLPKAERLYLAYLRRVISYCHDRIHFRLDSLVQELRVPEHLRDSLIQELENLSVLKQTTSHQPPLTIRRSVKKKVLAKHLKQYFPTERNMQDNSINYGTSGTRTALSEVQNHEENFEGVSTRSLTTNRRRMLDPNVFLQMCSDDAPSRKRTKVSDVKKK